MVNAYHAKPVIYIIMPAYNAEAFVEESIRSVIGQTYRNWKLTVIDDCSSDNTVAVIRKLAEEDSRISLVCNEENLGVAKTRNSGLEMHAGEYVALLDSDDVWLPEKLERQMARMLETNADVLYCSYGIIDENGRKSCEDFIVPETVDFNGFLSRSVISCSTALFSPAVTKQYRFRTDLYHEDLELWLRLLRDGKTACGNSDVLACYRVMQGTRAGNKVRSALHRWKVYRDGMGFPVHKCVSLMFRYGILGLKKYKKLSGSEE